LEAVLRQEASNADRKAVSNGTQFRHTTEILDEKEEEGRK
jgi:hypothetical protein